MSERVAVQKVIGSRAGVETSPVRRAESPVKQTRPKADVRNSIDVRASTASSANRSAKSQGTAKKAKAAAQPAASAGNKMILEKKAIDEMKAFIHPPEGVKNVLAAVATMMGHQDCSWTESKKMMANPNHFIGMINAYDRDNVSAANLAKVRKFTSQDDFLPQVIMK